MISCDQKPKIYVIIVADVRKDGAAMLTYTQETPAKATEFTKLFCPKCNERVQRIVLAKGSKVNGLKFKCKKCGEFWRVTSD